MKAVTPRCPRSRRWSSPRPPAPSTRRPDGTAPERRPAGLDPDGEGPTPPFLLHGLGDLHDAFLTAAHCIEAIPGADWSVTLDGGAGAARLRRASFADFPLAYTRGPVRGEVVHPDFAAAYGAHDLAVLRFRRARSTVTPVELPTAGLLDDLAARGASRRTVTRSAMAPMPRSGRRATSSTATARRRRHRCRPSPRCASSATCRTAQGWLCYGDSGSPQFLGGSESNLVVSLLSHGLTRCRGAARAQRLDTVSAREFLSQFIVLP